VLRESDAAAGGAGAWRIAVIRGEARAQLKQRDLAGAEFDRAMYLVDVGKEDFAAEHVAVRMFEALGPEAAGRRLKARRPQRWLMGLGMAQLDKQDWQGAVETADQLVDAYSADWPEPQRQRALWMTAQLYAGAAETMPTLAKAEQVYLKYISQIESDPDLHEMYITALNNLAYMLADHPTEPDAKKALPYSQKAWDLMGTGDGYKGFVADTQGWVLIQLGRLDEGIAILREAIARSDEDSAEMTYHLGEALRRQGLAREALVELEKAGEQFKREKRISPLVGERIEESIQKAREKLAGE
jgi:tetratricopeptide (TPR) repeat protein